MLCISTKSSSGTQYGDLDIVMLSGDQVEQVEGDPELMVTGAGYLWYLTLNMHDVPALDNQNMRLALSNAVNRVSIVEDVVKDGSVATYTAVPPRIFCIPSPAMPSPPGMCLP